MRYFTFLFCTKLSKSSMYSVRTMPLNSGWPHVKWSSHKWLMATFLDSTALERLWAYDPGNKVLGHGESCRMLEGTDV